MSARDAILEGAAAAKRAHVRLNTKSRLTESLRSVDVFGAIVDSGASVLFRPLDGLLGAYMSEPSQGVIISTQRSLPIQRFTGGHEFGHLMLGHKASLDDDDILNGGQRNKTDQEIAANAFASEFLAPDWLLGLHAKKQGWTRSSLEEPRTVYQLSLRIGLSYEATCVSLNRFGFVDAPTMSKLQSVQPRTIKRKMLEPYSPPNLYRDVWILTERDEGTICEGQPDDVFVFHLREEAAGGYLWDASSLETTGFGVVVDLHDVPFDKVGSPVDRRLAAQAHAPGRGKITLKLQRPWEDASKAVRRLNVSFDLRGKEVGLPRVWRDRMSQAA